MVKKTYNARNYLPFFGMSMSHAIKFITMLALLVLEGNHIHIDHERPTKKITVFIHGTLMPFLALLNPFKTYTQTIKPKDWYYKCLQALRSDSDLLEDSIILEEGLKKIDPLLLYQCSKLHTHLTKATLPGKGAYQAISAYDMLDKYINNEQEHKHTCYYTFGFNGILSHSHRKEAGLKLYEELNKLVKECLKSGFKPILHLCGYSHGGNLILLLAHAELIYKQNLHIDKAMLFGTPIQAETAIYSNHPMFSNIYNFFSEGDHVQNSDSFSTSSASSYRTFKELSKAHNLVLQTQNVYDIRLLVSHNPAILGHFSYWFFNKYSDSWTNNHEASVKSVLTYISPLPVAVFGPVFLALIDKNVKNLNDLDINLKTNNQTLEIELLDSVNKTSITTLNDIQPIINNIKKFTKTSAYPRDINNPSISSFLKSLGASINTVIQNITE